MSLKKFAAFVEFQATGRMPDGSSEELFVGVTFGRFETTEEAKLTGASATAMVMDGEVVVTMGDYTWIASDKDVTIRRLRDEKQSACVIDEEDLETVSISLSCLGRFDSLSHGVRAL